MPKTTKTTKTISKTVKKAAVSEKVVPAKKTDRHTVKVYDLSAKAVGTVSLSKDVFDVSASDRLLATYVRVHLANQHRGTKQAKTRGEVIGSTKKIYRQKGTGRARHGARKAPIFVGGGVAHGPKPFARTLKMNKPARRKALYYALSQCLKNDNVVVVSDWSVMEPKTKALMATFKNFNFDVSRQMLLVYQRDNLQKVQTAAGNLKQIQTREVTNLNAYDVLRATKVFFDKPALEILNKQHAN